LGLADPLTQLNRERVLKLSLTNPATRETAAHGMHPAPKNFQLSRLPLVSGSVSKERFD
jgi:hypothetical protein